MFEEILSRKTQRSHFAVDLTGDVADVTIKKKILGASSGSTKRASVKRGGGRGRGHLKKTVESEKRVFASEAAGARSE